MNREEVEQDRLLEVDKTQQMGGEQHTKNFGVLVVPHKVERMEHNLLQASFEKTTVEKKNH